MIQWLSRAYRRIGIHASPPGTLLFLLDSLVRRIVHRRIFGYVTGNAYTRARYGGIAYYNIARVRRTRPVSGFALVYFMGVGDYLMTTPLIRTLHLAHPDLPIYAYASSHNDHVNSSLVSQLLRTNPLVDRVFTYAGKPRLIWTDYDFSDALKDIPKDFLVLPVFYDVEPVVFHRATSVLETFGLPVDLPVPVPIVYPTDRSAAAEDTLDRIQERVDHARSKGVVCVHFGARSSGYEYAYAESMIRQLVHQGYVVVSFSRNSVTDANVVEVDFTKVSLSDSIEILRTLKARHQRLYMISVNSLMWPISAGLDIPNLGLHTFWDPSIHQYLYPNIYVVTQHFYERLPPTRCFQAPPRAFQERKLSGNIFFTDYLAEYAMDCFNTMVEALGH